MTKWTVGVLSTAIAFAGIAVAGPKKGEGDKPKRTPEEVFKKADKNGDGKLSLEEFVGKKTDDKKAKAEARFKKLDKDGDGKLSLEELKAGAKPKKS